MSASSTPRQHAFLLLAGDTAAYRDRTATIQVASLAPVLAALESAGAEVSEGPAPAPSGARLVARHPDGAIFEYIETGTPLRAAPSLGRWRSKHHSLRMNF